MPAARSASDARWSATVSDRRGRRSNDSGGVEVGARPTQCACAPRCGGGPWSAPAAPAAAAVGRMCVVWQQHGASGRLLRADMAYFRSNSARVSNTVSLVEFSHVAARSACPASAQPCCECRLGMQTVVKLSKGLHDLTTGHKVAATWAHAEPVARRPLFCTSHIVTVIKFSACTSGRRSRADVGKGTWSANCFRSHCCSCRHFELGGQARDGRSLNVLQRRKRAQRSGEPLPPAESSHLIR